MIPPVMGATTARAAEIIQECRDRSEKDSGKHYRWEYKGVKLDPYRIASIYGVTDHALFTALKKILCAGNRGGKGYEQDITEARDALNRKLEMIQEDLG